MHKFLTFVILLFFAVGLFAAEDNIVLFKPLVGSDVDARNRAYQVAIEDRKVKVQELILLTRTEAVTDDAVKGKEMAMNLLGQFRATEAVALLADQLMFLPPPGRITAMEPVFTETFYPAVRALVAIGEPSDAYGLMLQKIIDSKRAEERDLATWVIMQIVGKHEALYRLTAVFQETPENNVQTRIHLRKAIEYINQFKQTYGYPKASTQ